MGRQRWTRKVDRLWQWLVVLIMAIAGAIAIASCQSPSPQQSIRIGTTRWPGYDIALYGNSAGIFAQRGLEPEFIQFDVTQDTVRAVLRGALDFAMVPLWDVLQADSGEEAPAWILVTNVSAGADGVVAQAGIDTLAALQGKTVAAKLGSVNHLVLLEALNSQHMAPEAVEIADLSNEAAASHMEAGTVDGAVLWQPLLGQVADAIGGNILFTTADVNSRVLDGVIVRESFLASQPDTVRAFLLAWFDIMAAVEREPETVFAAVGAELGQSGEAFAADYGGLRKGDRDRNREFFLQGGMAALYQDTLRLLEQDSRHGRVVRTDLHIASESMANALDAWQP